MHVLTSASPSVTEAGCADLLLWLHLVFIAVPENVPRHTSKNNVNLTINRIRKLVEF